MYVSQHRHPSRFVALRAVCGLFAGSVPVRAGLAVRVRWRCATRPLQAKGLVETGGSNKSQPLRLPFPNRFFPGLHSAC